MRGTRLVNWIIKAVTVIAMLAAVAIVDAGERSAWAQGSEAPASSPSAITPTSPPSSSDTAPIAASPLPAAAPAASKPPGIAREHLPHELSPWGMFLAADTVVKGVMIFLALASVLVWSAWIGKHIQLSLARRTLHRRTTELIDAPSLHAVAASMRDARDAAAMMVTAARDEIERSDHGTLSATGIKERIGSQLGRIEAGASRAMTTGTGLLATIGGTAPFIGLFGTVWGIMNSFIGISKAQTTNLAVVAPGIAEALLATAIGLVAAIPAVIFYNQLARAITGYKAGLADAAAAVERLASRDLDRHAVAARTLRAAE